MKVAAQPLQRKSQSNKASPAASHDATRRKSRKGLSPPKKTIDSLAAPVERVIMVTLFTHLHFTFSSTNPATM
jgi:hypothetical protein